MTEMASDEASAGNLARTNARRLWIHDPVRFVLHVLHYTFRTTRFVLHASHYTFKEVPVGSRDAGMCAQSTVWSPILSSDHAPPVA